MSVLVLHVRMVEPVQTKWISSNAPAQPDIQEQPAKQVNDFTILEIWELKNSD